MYDLRGLATQHGLVIVEEYTRAILRWNGRLRETYSPASTSSSVLCGRGPASEGFRDSHHPVVWT